MSGDLDDPNVECLQEDEVSCNLDKVYIYLKNGLIEKDDIDLSCYISAYKELYK